jgi:hypothetical protein
MDADATADGFHEMLHESSPAVALRLLVGDITDCDIPRMA